MKLIAATATATATAAATALLFVALFQSTESMDYTIAKTRNQYLRLYVFHKKRKIHSCAVAASNLCLEKLNKTFNSVLSKYYDANIFYYSLSDNERELMDQILNNCL
jgi:hypothetical protein